MRKVNVTDLRQHLSRHIRQVQRGEPIRITSHGKVVARLVPERDAVEEARKSLAGWRGSARIGDVLSPVGQSWEAEGDRM